MTSDQLFRKIQLVFGDLAVNKRLAATKEYAMLPRYVTEYLVSEFMREHGTGYASKLSEFVASHYREARERDKLLHDLMNGSNVRLIDEIKVETDVLIADYRTHLMNLGLRDAMIARHLVDRFENLLMTGMWGLAELTYAPDIVPKDAADNPLLLPVMVTDFRPFQSPVTDPQIVIDARESFSFDEWVDVLINTVGLNHERYDFRQKIVLLSRLVPLIENNVNLLELGPRATGKTYIYRNVTYYTRIFSGGNVSPAVLFYNIARGSLGEIAVKDAVVFDEISKIRFANPDEMMGKLKDYMESSHFERGPKKAYSTASLVFMGNIKVEFKGKAYAPLEDIPYALPDQMRKDSAFVDRLNGIVPGWELPKISHSALHLSIGYGIASDYFAEFLHAMRRVSYEHVVEQEAEITGNYTIRDEKSIKRLAGALLKLLVPNATKSGVSREEMRKVMEVAVEYRNQVRELLHLLDPGEFAKEKLGFRVR
ncbi:MAG: BREX system Lon protease-like protein BrxL [Thermoproteota archaeon]